MTTTTPTVVEICCGMGGARKAFSDAGFDVIQSIDIDEVICEFHRNFWGDADHLDINFSKPSDIKKADVLTAGFPCQPFSTSGYRTGFDHKQGNVFLSLLKLIDHHGYAVTLLENVQGLLSNDSGRTFKYIIAELSMRYKTVEWITFNLLSLEIPMNRPRVIILAHNEKVELLKGLSEQFYETSTPDLFLDELKIPVTEILQDTTPNQPAGTVIDRHYRHEVKVLKKINFKGDLMEFIFGENIGNFKVYSGRFWGRTGKTIFYTSENQYSHSVGTSMGGAPTFGFDPIHLNKSILSSVSKVANYTTEHSGYFVFRLSPKETLRLFGPRAEVFSNLIEDYKSPLVTKYKMIGNMFSPDQAMKPIECLTSILVPQN